MAVEQLRTILILSYLYKIGVVSGTAIIEWFIYETCALVYFTFYSLLINHGTMCQIKYSPTTMEIHNSHPNACSRLIYSYLSKYFKPGSSRGVIASWELNANQMSIWTARLSEITKAIIKFWIYSGLPLQSIANIKAHLFALSLS